MAVNATDAGHHLVRGGQPVASGFDSILQRGTFQPAESTESIVEVFVRSVEQV
jgi:hypothetical protein